MTNTRHDLSKAQTTIINKLQQSRYYKQDYAFNKFFSQLVAYENADEIAYDDTEKQREDKIELRKNLKQDKNFLSIYTGAKTVSYTTPLSTYNMAIRQDDPTKEPTLFQVTFRDTPKLFKFTFCPASKISDFSFNVTSIGTLEVVENTQDSFKKFVFTHPELADYLASLELKPDQEIREKQNQHKRNPSPF